MRSIKSVEKGLYILEVIADFPNGARVKDISDRMDGSISNVTLFLNSLMLAGFISKDNTHGRYYLSQKISDIAEKSDRAQYSLLKEISAEEMRKLRDDLNENVLLAVMSGHDIHFIERLQSSRSVQILHNTDTYYPPHVTAGGKAILAYLSPERQEKYIEDGLYHQFTDKSLINPRMLRAELKTIREKGYAVNRGEFEDEIMAVAAPVVRDNAVVASLVVQFPKFRYNEENLSDFGDRIMQVAGNIEERIRSANASPED